MVTADRAKDKEPAAGLLVESLRDLQREHGLLPRAGLTELAGRHAVSLSRIYGVAASYPEFSFEEETEGRRLHSPPTEEPEFFSRIIRAGEAELVEAGPLTARFDRPPESLDDYRQRGGMQALSRTRGDMKPEQVLAEVVLGRLTRKGEEWQAAAVAEGPVIVANCHEGDPIAGQATSLLARDPWSVIEGMHCAAAALGASGGFIYTAPLEEDRAGRLKDAIEQTGAAAGDGFTVELVQGSDSLVGSEDSVARAVINGLRPVPSASGDGSRVHGRVSVVDSGELFANVTAVLAGGKSSDTRLYRVSGAVDSPGIIEADASVTVRDLAIRAGTHAGAQALVGGMCGVFLTEGQLDQRMSDLKPADNPRWRTVHMLRDRRDIYPNAQEMAAYNAGHLCGHCVPCRIGSVRMAEMIAEFPPDMVSLGELADTLVVTALCPVGRGAAGMIRSALKRIL